MQLYKHIRRWGKKILALAPVPFSRNERIDRITKKIIQQIASENNTCIDVGAHEGKILEWMIRYIPSKQHLAFEPLPKLFETLQQKFGQHAHLYPLAVSDQQGVVDFNEVLTDPAYSGILRRPYPRVMQDRIIKVNTDTLDHLVPKDLPISLIKIDVEGGELSVLRGSKNLIHVQQPILLFECGKAGGDTYGYQAKEMYEYLNRELEYQIYLPKDWVLKKNYLSQAAFEQYYQTGSEFFFLAAPAIR